MVRESKGKAGAADPMRVVRLLWEPAPAPARGRKPGIALEEIVAAAIRIADDKGVDALSMRQVAAGLGVGTMSLYTYVSSKAELVELMVDRAFGELRHPARTRPPRERLARLSAASWVLYLRHPWILQTNLWRFSLGPNVLDRAEAVYAALADWGVEAVEIPVTARMIDAFVQGAARSRAVDRETERLTGESMDAWFGARMDFWETYFDVERYPVHNELWHRGGFDGPVDPFRFGLERLLDAVEMGIREAPSRREGDGEKPAQGARC